MLLQGSVSGRRLLVLWPFYCFGLRILRQILSPKPLQWSPLRQILSILCRKHEAYVLLPDNEFHDKIQICFVCRWGNRVTWSDFCCHIYHQSSLQFNFGNSFSMQTDQCAPSSWHDGFTYVKNDSDSDDDEDHLQCDVCKKPFTEPVDHMVCVTSPSAYKNTWSEQ